MNRRAQTILCGSIVNCVTAVVVVASLLTMWSVLTSRNLKDLVMFPWWIWAVAIFTVPFSFIVGLIGMAFLTRARSQHPAPSKYKAEAIILGAVLGASFPGIAVLLQLDELVSWAFFVLGVVSGGLCGLIIGSLSQSSLRSG